MKNQWLLNQLRLIWCKIKNIESGSTGGGIQSVQPGTNVTVDNTDPLNPIVSATSSNTSYVHDQAQPSSIWTINHPLNKKPSVTITDTAGTVVEGNVIINDNNQIVIEFNFPFSGKAILN